MKREIEVFVESFSVVYPCGGGGATQLVLVCPTPQVNQLKLVCISTGTREVIALSRLALYEVGAAGLKTNKRNPEILAT